MSTGLKTGFARQGDVSAFPIRRLLLLAVTIGCVLATLLLLRAVNERTLQARDRAIAEAWRTQSVTQPKVALEQIAGPWSMRVEASTDSRSATWTVGDLRELRSSLLALDSTAIAVRKITVNKRDASWSINAELAP
ncbi:MAG: hypothetical protein EAZ30_00145 [Betaproteobacteria bacterium]|nr:MAG: hypothetical protein EAZ30_00145 [Betaproteobacteria bacterium]